MDAAHIPEGIQLPPDAVAPPVPIQDTTDVIPLWSGKTQLTQASGVQKGDANVFFDNLPRPMARFTFQGQSDLSGFEQWRRAFEGRGLEEGVLACDSPLGQLDVSPSNVKGTAVSGIGSMYATSPAVYVGKAPSHQRPHAPW